MNLIGAISSPHPVGYSALAQMKSLLKSIFGISDQELGVGDGQRRIG